MTCHDLIEALVDYVQHDANHLGAVRRQAKPWWTRSFAPAAWRQYRATSAMLFADRRSAAASLVREGCAGARIGEMFRCGAETGFFRLTVLYWSAALRFLLNGQRRRAALCLRFLDAALRELNHVRSK